jgi:hypothetical protein
MFQCCVDGLQISPNMDGVTGTREHQNILLARILCTWCPHCWCLMPRFFIYAPSGPLLPYRVVFIFHRLHPPPPSLCPSGSKPFPLFSFLFVPKTVSLHWMPYRTTLCNFRMPIASCSRVIYVTLQSGVPTPNKRFQSPFFSLAARFSQHDDWTTDRSGFDFLQEEQKSSSGWWDGQGM